MSTGKIIPVLVSILAVALLSLLTQAFALDQNGIIQMPFTENPPSIDGQWTTANEWKDASVTSVGNNPSNIFYILAKHDRDNIYLMIDLVNEQVKPANGGNSKKYAFQPYNIAQDSSIPYATVSTENNPQANDVGTNRDFVAYSLIEFCFDTNNDGGNVLKTDDFCFYGFGNHYSNKFDNTVARGNGNGGTDFIVNPYGFQIISGFVSDNDPYESGRNHIVYEVKIPISFLHKSDSYGFQLMIPPLSSGTDYYLWPASYPSSGFDSHFIPSAFGTILAPNQSITIPPVPVISISSKSLSFGSEEVSGKSSSQTVTISNAGTGILKINSISMPDEFSISGIKTPVDVPPNQSVIFDVIMAPITVGEKSGVITISSNDLSNPSLTIPVEGKGVEKGKSPFGGKCLIATAAFGSELSPQVQFLRGFRDNHILATESGSSFMNVFNAWYYSFSPYVADYERQQPWLQEIVRTSIYPLLGILTLSEKGFSTVQGDYGAVVAGSIASSMIGAVYFWPFAMIAKPIRNSTSKYNYKIALAIFGTTLIATVVSILSANQTALMITTSLFVLSLTAISATLSARYIVRVIRKLINRNFLSEIHKTKA